jgi:hypothetical protein
MAHSVGEAGNGVPVEQSPIASEVGDPGHQAHPVGEGVAERNVSRVRPCGGGEPIQQVGQVRCVAPGLVAGEELRGAGTGLPLCLAGEEPSGADDGLDLAQGCGVVAGQPVQGRPLRDGDSR